MALPHRMQNERRGKATHNVMGSPEARRVEEAFKTLGRMTWGSFVQAPLPLLFLPEDQKGSLSLGEGEVRVGESRSGEKPLRHGPVLLGGSAEASGLPGGSSGYRKTWGGGSFTECGTGRGGGFPRTFWGPRGP
ncbi:parB-like partition protein [Thermus thermophilus]|nr:parB-like partition protein [Thermus thermophilus]BDB11153.1 hypothetical protein TthTMY_08920 [Thermus thermophilus]